MKPELNEAVLLRLCHDAMITMYGCGAGFTSRAVPGASMVLSGERVADLNYLIAASSAAGAIDGFSSFVRYCDERELPFCSIIAASEEDALESVCEGHRLVHATQWPLMVCPGERAEEKPTPGVTVRAVATAADVTGMCRVLSGAFGMAAETIARSMPLELYDSPSISTCIAECEGEVLSSVTITRHGGVVGVWAMGTLAAAQGKGIGKALLSTVMAAERADGATSFFLGATPAGLPLYEKLGYATVFSAQVWVRGETNQA